jgi:hypothetical protein
MGIDFAYPTSGIARLKDFDIRPGLREERGQSSAHDRMVVDEKQLHGRRLQSAEADLKGT